MGTSAIKKSVIASLSGLALFLGCAAAAYAATANDPFYVKQTNLQQIRMEEAWETARGQAGVTIAIVDTGVQLSHPDLKPNLVPGVNLIDPSLPPEDDNGHGTNVAGIIGAVGNNDRGVAGMLWRTKLMPIKALEGDGAGDEQRLGEAIRYAVDHGAKIVVLSLGLNKYSAYMSDIVRYAEEKEVLLVAATGNEGNRVKYPAAYSTVLAVGGVNAAGKADARSNSGLEVDVVAPWNVYTTAMGSTYEYKDGTSMAAPQVAAAAALLWEREPRLKPHDIRQRIRHTAQDLNAEGWDAATGHGLLRVDRLLNERSLQPDMYEPNDRKDKAKAISVSNEMAAAFASGADSDWYYADSPYEGTVNLTLTMGAAQELLVQHVDASGQLTTKSIQGGQTVPFKVTKGRSYFQLQLANRSYKELLPYRITTFFEIYRDPFEDNDKQYKAYVLPGRSQTVKGTFHQYHDTDWYQFPVESSGTLKVTLSADTARIDAVLLIQRQGEKSVTIDLGDDGVSEVYTIPEVFQGNYYIRVNNVKEYENPIVGEYTLNIQYDAKLVDPNEPNDRSYQATAVSLDTEYGGLLDKARDADWYQFEVEEESYIQLVTDDIPQHVQMYMTLYDGTLRPMGSSMNEMSERRQQLNGKFAPGRYYVKLTASREFDHQMYQFSVRAKPLTSGFIDIRGHWGEQAIAALTSRKVIDGYGDYTFQPNRPITRAEATAVLSRAFGLSTSKSISYYDLNTTHWAYDYIARASQAGMIEGYPDGTFAPDQPVTRMEMTAMLARSLNKAGKVRGQSPFTDIPDSYWGAGLLKQMKGDGLIDGYADGSFRPDQQATRAEFVQLLFTSLR
ncbi:S8 family serine peptidase [Paenibacillus sp. YYML68]|uniref:S8 family serine peptidase n=1 Tax=Paenibacillus sp. YYML68 TaxID=2909250 RepID=UPI0024911945|nr:S8 family serine peptidase [Paenibacillus sp. YYML68]